MNENARHQSGAGNFFFIDATHSGITLISISINIIFGEFTNIDLPWP